MIATRFNILKGHGISLQSKRGIRKYVFHGLEIQYLQRKQGIILTEWSVVITHNAVFVSLVLRSILAKKARNNTYRMVRCHNT